MIASVLLSFWIGLLPAMAAPTTPASPERPQRERPPPPERPGFSGDALVGWTIGTLAAPSVNSGATGTLLARYDAFATRRSTGGPRLGFSVWGAFHTAPFTTWTAEASQAVRADESDVAVDLSSSTVGIRRYGLMTVLRHDPASRVSADVGFGFGRVDLDASPWGRTALPALTFEAGLRHHLPVERLFMTWTARGSWIETPSSASGWPAEEWWFVEFGPSIGYGMNTGGR
ncbi:MAG: hypothetical protein CL927_15530 [Deltaproteobacteria bacterium]|nr:hypothetical protein [Deltaproteobacteria bacterium]HCH61758.1 hypothetical protein [Deltaproteobacteria bacterium]